MDNHLLQQFEEQLAPEIRFAYNLAGQGLDDARWGAMSGRILEDLSGVVDYLKRTVGGWPHDEHYVRSRSGDLVDAAVQLHQRTMRPALRCDAEVVEIVEDADDGSRYNVHDSCPLPVGHQGQHTTGDTARTQLLDAADELEQRVVAITRRLRWNLASDDEYTAEALDDLASELRDLGGEVRARLNTYRHDPATAEHGDI